MVAYHVPRRPVLATPRKSIGRVAVDLYRGGGSFRSLAEFSAIGLVVLAFLSGADLANPVNLKKLASAFLQPATKNASTDPLSNAPKLNARSTPLAPRLQDIEIGRPYFASAPETTRDRLFAAFSAYETRQYETVLKLLDSASTDDRYAALLRGLALIALPGASNFPAGLRLIERAADLNDPKAMSVLGVFKLSGLPGFPRDIEGGRRLLERAAALGDMAALRIMGEGYLSGWMGAIDAPRALNMFRKASEAGHLGATFRLAEMHMQGLGTAQNQVEAERLLLKAAESNHAEAQAMLGLWRLIPYISGVSSDPDHAIEWLERAALQGQPRAMETLGLFYVEYGKRTGRQDPARGVDYFRRCTEQTLDVDCAFAYATALDLGIGTHRDPVRSYAMFLIANTSGSLLRTRARLDEIGKTMSDSERARAHAIASQMLAKRQGTARSAQGYK